MIKPRVADSDSQLLSLLLCAQLCGGEPVSVLVTPAARSSARETGVCLHPSFPVWLSFKAHLPPWRKKHLEIKYYKLYSLYERFVECKKKL